MTLPLWWRDPRQAGRLMTAWFLLSLLTGPVVSVHQYGDGGPPRATILTRVIGWALSAFLAWRVTRGGRFSRTLLILAAVGGCIAGVIALAVQFSLAGLGLLPLQAAQLALLLSPAVYRRSRPGGLPGETVALWRRRAPAPLVAALAAGAALGLAGTAVSAAVISRTDRDYSRETVRLRPGQPAGVTLPPGSYTVLGGCSDQWGCVLLEPRDVTVVGALSGPVTLVADKEHAERDLGDQQFSTDLDFTVPVQEPVTFTLTPSRFQEPAFVITPARDRADAVRRWRVSVACFGLLLLGSLAGLAWPVRRRGW